MNNEKEIKEINIVYLDGVVAKHNITVYELIEDATILYFYTIEHYRMYIMLSSIKMFNVTEPVNMKG